MPVLVLLFLVSGAAGLIYESVWARYLGLLAGHSAYAQVIVLVIFLGGMAIGSFAASRWSERIERPLRAYAAIEGIVAVLAIAFPLAFAAATHLAYDVVLPALPSGIASTAAMWTIAALLILPQSILLGATFPLMTTGALRMRAGRPGASIALLYFANSFGAAIGALVEGFVLLGAFGLDGTLRVAAALNVLAAVGTLAVSMRAEHQPLPTPDALPERSTGAPPRSRDVIVTALLALSFATAFSSFCYEIAWTRLLSLVHGSATHSFEIMLSAFVLGLALGALWVSRVADGSGSRLVLLGVLQWAMGIAAIATLPLYSKTFDWSAALLTSVRDNAGGYRLYSIGRYAMTLGVMLPATFLAGTTLPLITRVLLDRSGERAVGRVYGINTVGSIVGVMTAALILVPMIGLTGVLITGAIVDVAFGVLLVTWGRSGSGGQGWRVATGGAAVATLAVLIAIPKISPLSPTRLDSGVYRYGFMPREGVFRYLFHRDGRTATVSVRQDAGDTNALLALSTNGKPDASVVPAWIRPYVDGQPKMVLDQDMSTQLLLPLLVLAHAPAAGVGAVVGQGSGISSHILLASPALRRLYTIEIEPQMIEGSRLFHPGNRRVFDDVRSTFVIDDARAFLSSRGPLLDFVVSEPSNPWVSGVSGLFTVEFYERVRTRLTPGGVFVQWFHLYELDDATVTSVLAGLDRAFDDYRVYLTSNTDVVIVAAAGGPLRPADWRVARMPTLAAELSHFNPLDDELLEAMELGGRRVLHPYVSQKTPNSDIRPVLDLNAERLRFQRSFAAGFRDVIEGRFDWIAMLERRTRGFGRAEDTPAPEIFRALARARGAMLRSPDENAALLADDSTRKAAWRRAMFMSALDQPPSDWTSWLEDFRAVETDLHLGTVGVADEAFYAAVRAYATTHMAPIGVRASVDFLHGLAAGNDAEASNAGNILAAHQMMGGTWIPTELLRRGLAVARMRMDNRGGALAAYRSIRTVGGRWDLVDDIIEDFISRDDASGVPARPPG